MASHNDNNGPKGLGGWLIFHWIAHVRGVIFLPLATYVSYGEIQQISRDFGSHNSITQLAQFEIFVSIAFIGLQIFLFYLFITKDYRYAKVFIWIAIAGMVVPIIDIMALKSIAPYANLHDKEIIQAWLGPILAGLIWIPYMLKSRRVANTFVEGRPSRGGNQHDLAPQAEHVVPNVAARKELNMQREAIISPDGVGKDDSSQSKELILEYDDEARTAYRELAEKAPKFADTFLQKLLDDPESDIEQIKAESIKDNLPFDTEELNVAYLSLEDLGPDAQSEFVQVAGALGARLELATIVKKIRHKFESEAYLIITQLKKNFNLETREQTNGVFIVTDRRGNQVGRYTSAKGLKNLLSLRKIEARKMGYKF